jgi:hypothetical protein
LAGPAHSRSTMASGADALERRRRLTSNLMRATQFTGVARVSHHFLS